MPDWMTDTWFLVGMAVLLIALVGVFFFLRSRRPED